MSSNFQNFVTFIKETNLSRTNLFQVIVTGPNSGGITLPFDGTNFGLMAESVSHPSLILGYKDARISGPKDFRPDGTVDFEHTTNITFFLDQKHKIRKFFLDWNNLIIDKNSFTVNYQDNYIANTLIINQLDRNDQVLSTTTLREVYPYIVGSVDHATNESNQFGRVTIGFVFKDFIYS